METAKIISIQPSGMNAKKEMYVNEIELDNRMRGITWSKSQTPPYAVGDIVTFEPSLNRDGETYYFKGMKKADSTSTQPQKSDMTKDDWRKKDVAIIYQNAYTQANAHLGAVGYDGKSRDQALKMLMDYADAIAQDVIKKSGI